MADQDFLQNSILTSPLQVGAMQGLSMPQQGNAPAPQNPFAQSSQFLTTTPDEIIAAHPGSSVEEEAIHNYMLQKTMNDLGMKQQASQNQYQQDYQKASDKTPRGKVKRSLMDIFRYGPDPQGSMGFLKDQEVREKIQQEKINDDLRTLSLFPKRLAGKTPEQIDALMKYGGDLSKIEKERADTLSQEALRKAQAKEAYQHGDLFATQTEAVPQETLDKQRKTSIEATKAYGELLVKQNEFQFNQTKENREAYDKAYDRYIKLKQADTAVAAENRLRGEAETEQVQNPATKGMMQKHPGLTFGKSLSRLLLQPPPAPPGRQAYPTNPQIEQVLNSLAGQTGIPPIQGQAGQLAAPPPAGPPPSLVGPQPQPGGPITPTQAASSGIGIPINPQEGIPTSIGAMPTNMVPRLQTGDTLPPSPARELFDNPPSTPSGAQRKVASMKKSEAMAKPQNRDKAKDKYHQLIGQRMDPKAAFTQAKNEFPY